MTGYHGNKVAEQASPLSDLQKYFQITPAVCPYKLPLAAAYKHARFSRLPEPLMSILLAGGYRRNANSIYTMQCPDCLACVPLRLAPGEFTPNRSQKRTLGYNLDLRAEIEPLCPTDEKMRLFDLFLKNRYPGPDTSAEDYYAGFFMNTITNTFEICYRQGTRLIGVGIFDLGTTWLNAVYFYFDPAEKKRSPGTYNILALIDFCKQHGIDHLYLGYWIKAVKAMSYKARFRPHHLLLNGCWTAAPECPATSAGREPASAA
ncbi:MAG: hypothetical protein A2521_14290 [Deltaproteobacteria bacterium RIFOXYD12_FULL_57_12]|nr:MAG: hypothetical protein A2521_14290 [Deltaproteobacteria bacterium RIFOXYD12_FULL_57_12]